MKRTFKSWVILSISCSFMLFVFAPLETYLTNVQEFWFYIRDLIPILSVCFFSAAAVFIVAGYIIRKWKYFLKVSAVFFSLYIGLYIQGNFIPRDYGVLDGKEIDWTQYTTYGILSFVLWGVMIGVCLFLCKWMSKYICIICSYAGIMISLILLVTLGTLFFQNIHFEEDKNSIVVSQKDMLSLSGNENCIILLYDTFDSSYMREILDSNEGDKYREILSDFIYYPNTIGGYPTTKGSMPFVLTGQWYENEQPYMDYVKEAYEKTDFYDFLKKNNYTIGMYTSGMFLSNHTDIYKNVKMGTYSLKDRFGFTKDLYKLVGFHYLPHQLKRYAVVDTGDFDKYAESNSDDKAFSSMDVPEFLELLKEHGISVDETETKALRWYHLNGTHPPYEFNECIVKDGKEYTAVDEAKGCLESLKYYCDILKEQGIYDDSVVIVMADHGYQSVDCFRGSNPIFMVKERHADNEFQVSDMQVSFEDLLPTIETLLSGEKHDGDIWSMDTDEERRRRFLYYSWDDPDSSWNSVALSKMVEYETTGIPGEDSFCLLPTGAVFRYGKSGAEDVDQMFRVEKTENILVDNKKWDRICLCGVSEIETDANGKPYRWTLDRIAMFRFYIEDIEKGYRMELKYVTKFQENSVENINVKVNGEDLDKDAVVFEDNQILIDIPSELISDNDMMLTVEFPNAISPKEAGTGKDERKLAIALAGITIGEQQ